MAISEHPGAAAYAPSVGPTTQIGEDGEEMNIAVSNIAFCQRCLRAFVSSDAVVSRASLTLAIWWLDSTGTTSAGRITSLR